MRIGVIGTGMMGKNHVRVLKEMGVLAAISDCNKKTLNKISKQYKIKQAYVDHDEMLEKENLDGVIVAVTSKYHYDIVMDCFRHNVNVLVEKPISLNPIEATKMIREAEKKDIIFTVGHIERFNPVITKIKQLLKQKRLGKVHLVKAARVSPYPMRELGIQQGILIDIGVHDFDIIIHLFGDINDFHTKMIFSGSQDIYVKSMFRVNEDVMGSGEFSWISPFKKRSIEIFGEKGMLKGDYINQQLIFYNDTRTKVYSIKKEEPLKLELKHFIDCIKNNKQPIVSPRDAKVVLETVLAIYRSCEETKQFVAFK